MAPWSQLTEPLVPVAVEPLIELATVGAEFG